MNQKQLLLQLERFNDQIACSVEGLSAVAHMVEVCDQDEAPMPLQLADLLRVMASHTSNLLTKISGTIEELKTQS